MVGHGPTEIVEEYSNGHASDALRIFIGDRDGRARVVLRVVD